MIAMALALRPKLLIADEPTTALDVTIQAQVIDLIRGLAAQTGAAVLLITHDLGVVADLTQRTAVMYAGFIVETATTAELFAAPRHPYTVGLLHSIARIDVEDQGTVRAIEGQPPDARDRRPAARSRRAAPGGCPSAGPTTRRSSPTDGDGGRRHHRGRRHAPASPAITRRRSRRRARVARWTRHSSRRRRPTPTTVEVSAVVA